MRETFIWWKVQRFRVQSATRIGGQGFKGSEVQAQLNTFHCHYREFNGVKVQRFRVQRFRIQRFPG